MLVHIVASPLLQKRRSGQVTLVRQHWKVAERSGKRFSLRKKGTSKNGGDRGSNVKCYSNVNHGLSCTI